MLLAVYRETISYSFHPEKTPGENVHKKATHEASGQIDRFTDPHFYVDVSDKGSKIRLAQEALKLWLNKQTEALMAKGYEEMAEEEGAFAELTFAAQQEILTRRHSHHAAKCGSSIGLHLAAASKAASLLV